MNVSSDTVAGLCDNTLALPDELLAIRLWHILAPCAKL